MDNNVLIPAYTSLLGLLEARLVSVACSSCVVCRSPFRRDWTERSVNLKEAKSTSEGKIVDTEIYANANPEKEDAVVR